MTRRLELIATAAFGLEAVVSRELHELGYTEQTVEDGRVTFIGDELAICRCNLWLRAADRVLVKIGTFPARDFGELFSQVEALPWHEWLPVDAKFPVSCKSVRSQLHHEPTIQSVTKKAIVESLKRDFQRHWFQETGTEYQIEVSLLKDRALLSIDTSGTGLHRRGYRPVAGVAPLRETTAAALVLLSYWNRDRVFIDPFCGSGTIAIEAAMIGRNRAPGLSRNFLCENWPQLTRENWKQAREEARDKILGKPKLSLTASDIDDKVLRIAQNNAIQSGIGGDIEFKQMDVLEFKTSSEYGVIVTNPPYGERMGDDESAADIYDDMADAFEPLSTWSIYVLTAHPGFERFFRRRATRRRKLYNGRIECHYFQYVGPRPPWEKPADDAESFTDADSSMPDDEDSASGSMSRD
jgi:putative N6-adenine-specific DNA methylase